MPLPKTMNDEQITLEHFRLTGTNLISIPYDLDSERIADLFLSVFCDGRWSEWTDNSSHSDSPPDFFSIKDRYMMEVMQVDDHEYLDGKNLVNPLKKRESETYREIVKKMGMDEKTTVKTMMVNCITDLPSEEDHSYQKYVDSFKRVVEKHAKHIKLYKQNHPGYKLIIFIFDSSSAYMELILEDRKRVVKRGDMMTGRIHWWHADRRFVDVMKNLDVDCIIWWTPYKYIEGLPGPLPEITVLDPKHLNDVEDYDLDLMLSAEE